MAPSIWRACVALPVVLLTSLAQLQAAPVTSYHRCVGVLPRSRSCFFSDVFYSADKHEIVFVDPTNAVKAFGHHVWYTSFSSGNQTHEDPHVRAPFMYLAGYTWGHNAYRVPQGIAVPFEPVVVKNAPEPADTCVIDSVAVVMDTAYNAHHFGHWFVDYLYPIMRRLVQFGFHTSETIQMLSWIGPVGMFTHPMWQLITPLPPKALLPAAPDSIFQCSPANNTGMCCGKKWARLSKVIIGTGGASMDNAPHPHKSGHQVALPHVWREVRNKLYRKANLEVGAPAPPNGTILLIERSSHRQIVNIKDMQACLARRFPHHTVDTKAWGHFASIKEQLAYMASVSVVVSCQGTDSLQAPLLRDGAAMVLLGHPWIDLERPENEEAKLQRRRGDNPAPFHEWDRFYSDLDYIQPLFYALPKDAAPGVDFEGDGTLMYNYNIKPQCERLGDMVQQALGSVERYGRSLGGAAA